MLYGDTVCADTVTQGKPYARSLLCLFPAYRAALNSSVALQIYFIHFSHVSQLTDVFRCLVAASS
jgi:hypothetical protein